MTRRRIAVVGGGVSGLVAAYLLAPEHDAVIVVQSAAYDEPDAHARSFEVVEAALAQLPRTSPAP